MTDFIAAIDNTRDMQRKKGWRFFFLSSFATGLAPSSGHRETDIATHCTRSPTPLPPQRNHHSPLMNYLYHPSHLPPTPPAAHPLQPLFSLICEPLNRSACVHSDPSGQASLCSNILRVLCDLQDNTQATKCSLEITAQATPTLV